MNDTFMKDQPILPLVLSMSLPMVVSMTVSSLYNIVDSLFVSRISEEAMTALSLIFPLQNLISAVGIGFGVGINAVIARYLGAGKRADADMAATLGFFWNAVLGIVLSVGCILLSPAFLRFFTSDELVIDYALRYARIAFSFGLIICCGLSFEKIFQSVGRMVVSMASMMAGCIANIILDPVLIFGLGPFPRMGIEGAALATGLGQLLSFLIYLAVYLKEPLPVALRFKSLSFRNGITKDLYAVGVPAILNQAMPSLLISCLNGILAGFSQTGVLVLGVYYKLQTFLYLSSNGIVQGIRPLVAYNYGARMEQRVRKIFRTALSLSAGIMVLGTVLCQLLPGLLVGLFTENAATVAEGAAALRVISAGFVVSAVSVTACGTLEGLGMGFPSLVISLMRYLLFIVPAAFLLSRLFGAPGVWHAFWLTEWVTAGISFLLYRYELRRVFR